MIVFILLHHKRFLQFDVGGRGADSDFKLARFDGPFHMSVQELEVFGEEGEGDGFRFARLQGDTFETT